MRRVQRVNAHKDCLVCIVGVIVGGHSLIREEILNTKLFIISFIFSSFAYVSDLPDCTSILILIMITAIMIVIS